MFSKTNSPKPVTDTSRKTASKQVTAAPSILGPDLNIKGDITSDGDIQIDGRLDGNITAAKLTIGENGAVNGTIKAKWVHVRGRVSGKLTANVVEMAATANVQADISQDQLTIANGAFFDGKCTRLTPIQPTVKAAPAPVAVPKAAPPAAANVTAKKTA